MLGIMENQKLTYEEMETFLRLGKQYVKHQANGNDPREAWSHLHHIFDNCDDEDLLNEALARFFC